MKTLLATCLLAFAVLGFYIFDLRSDLAAARASAETVRESERKALSEIEPMRRDVERLTPAQNELQTKATNVATAGRSEPAADQKDGLLGGLGKVLAMPEMKSTIRRQLLGDTRKKFSELVKSWSLSKSDEDLFIEMVTDLESTGAEAFFAMLSGGGNGEAAFEKAEAAEVETKARIKSLLGETRFAEWEKAQEAESAREANASFKETMATAGLELPPAEETRLLKLVEDERRAAGLNSGVGEGLESVTSSEALIAGSKAELEKAEAYQARVLQKAVTFLNPDQISALQSAFNEENAGFKLGIEVMRQFLPADGKPAQSAAPGSARAR